MNITTTDIGNHIGRRVGNQGPRPSVSYQAGVEKYTTDTHYFDCRVVIHPMDLSRFKEQCRKNLVNLHLPLPEPKPPQKPKCSVSFNIPSCSTHSSGHPAPKPKPKRVKRCHSCRVIIVGRKGLTKHLGRSPDCKRNVPAPSQDSCCAPISDPQLTALIAEAIKSPSTSVESLENRCGDGSNTKIKVHNHNYRKNIKSCKLCPQLSTKCKFVSTSTHRIYDTVIPADIETVDCRCSVKD